MTGRFSRAAIAFAAFASGWSMMSLEILGGRLMAPYFGQTVYQWGALIGTAMSFMAIGYWAGGRLGETALARRALPLLLAGAAVLAAFTPLLGRMAAAMAALAFDPVTGGVVAAAVVLGLPACALAAVAPLCVGALAADGRTTRASGTASALNSAGSIAGTFFAAFVAVPYMGLSMGYAAAALVAASAAAATGLVPVRAALLLAPVALGVLADRQQARAFTEYGETPYNTIMVVETPTEVHLFTNTEAVVQSVRRKDGAPSGYYYDLLAAVPGLAKGRDALFLGVAGGSAVAAVQRGWPDVRAQGVEIDPGLTDVARRRFALTIPVTHDDARRYVEAAGPRYDMVFVDLYATGQIPPHTVTREFFAAVARRLAPGGVVAMNVFGAGDPAAITGSVAATLRAVFPSVLAADTPGGNTLLLAWAETVDAAAARDRLVRVPEAVRPAAETIARTLREAINGGAVLTDDRSDIDLRAAEALRRRAARGREADASR